MSVGIGIAGCGVIGQMHLKYLDGYPGGHLAAIADVRSEVLTETAQKYEPRMRYSDARDLLADPAVDGVVLALPADIRYELALEVLDAGKHLLLEKPVARNLAEVDAYLSRAKPGQIVAAASSRFRFTPSFAAVRAALDDGFGPVRQIFHEGIKQNPERPEFPPPPWRLSREQNGGGIMSNWGCYDLDFLLSLLDPADRPVEITATWRGIPEAITAWVAPGSDAETMVTAFIRFSSGALVVLNRGEYLPIAAPRNATTILSDNASVSCSIMSGDEPFTVSRYDESGVQTTEIWNEPVSSDAIHSGPIRDFVDAIAEGRQPATNLERSRVIQLITDTIYRSATEGRSITL
jgi:predicted dehydrogenase